MEYIYAALILNETGAEITEDNVTEILEAAGVGVDDARVKALVAALEDVDIEDAIEETAAVAAGGTAATTETGEADESEDEPEDEDEEAAEEAGDDDDDDDASAEGLGELFG